VVGSDGVVRDGGIVCAWRSAGTADGRRTRGNARGGKEVSEHADSLHAEWMFKVRAAVLCASV